MPSISAAGVGSNLDVNSLVTSIMAAESAPLTLLNTQKTKVESVISAFGSLKSSLSTFQTAVANLATASKFNIQAAKVSDSTVFSATANGQAVNSDYAIAVTQLAKNQKLALGGFANLSDIVGTGTLTIGFGTYNPTGTPVQTVGDIGTFTDNASKTPISITIDSSNNTLAGVRDTINNANAGVTASIVNDGSTNGNRLVITAKDSGAANSLKISVTDDDSNNSDNNGLSRMAYDPRLAIGAGKNLTSLQTAQDALLTIDGISISKSSNTITDALQGVTLNLLKTSTDSVNLNISTDSAAIETSVKSFVTAYNSLNTTIRNLTKYDETTKTGGALLGDSTTRGIASRLKSIITSSLANGSSLNTLSQIGIAFQKDGALALDSTKLQEKITSNFADIAKLFATSASTTDPQVSYFSSTNKTQAGTYAINVSQIGSESINTIGTINGVAATGLGTNLLGATGDASEGLNVKVLGTATGARGTITFSIGIAAQLNSLVTDYLSTEGLLNNKTEGLNSTVKRITQQQEAQNRRLAIIEKRYRAQFTALDSTISSMNSTSSFLTQQLNALSSNN